ncbi:hypothetical protein Tco_0485960, partial [Tanacetum coccineum]
MVLDTKLVKHHTECNPERAFLHNNDPMVLAVGKAFDELRETKAKGVLGSNKGIAKGNAMGILRNIMKHC